jgi:uncharacterized protein YcfL
VKKLCACATHTHIQTDWLRKSDISMRKTTHAANYHFSASSLINIHTTTSSFLEQNQSIIFWPNKDGLQMATQESLLVNMH